MSLIAKAIWYIESHLGQDLSLEAIAAATGVSRFHLSRGFGVATGFQLAVYVRARRLSEAAKVLAEGAPDILHIALESGYSSHEAFTRAFRQQFSLTPEQLRLRANVSTLQLQEPLTMEQTNTATVIGPRRERRDAILMFGLSQHYLGGQMAGIPSQWERFLPHLGYISGQVGMTAYGVIHNSDDAGNIDYMCGVEVSEFPSQPAEFTRLRIPPQTYAVFEHRDHISSVGATWAHVWNQGLSNAGYQATDGPAFERYGEEFDGRSGLGGLEIWVPVKA